MYSEFQVGGKVRMRRQKIKFFQMETTYGMKDMGLCFVSNMCREIPRNLKPVAKWDLDEGAYRTK